MFKRKMKKLWIRICKFVKKVIKKLHFNKDTVEKLDEYILREHYILQYSDIYDVNEKMVIFESFWGRQFSDSPKALYLAMCRDPKYADYIKIWAFKEPKKYKYLTEADPNTHVIKHNSAQYFKYHAMAKYSITNTRIPNRITIKESQRYIQCWHGTPLKRLGHDLELFEGSVEKTIKHKALYKFDASRYTCLLSPSDFYREKITSAFALKELGKENLFVQKGYPRNDFLYSHTPEDVQEIKERLGIPEDKKIILYAPTWRENQHSDKGGFGYELGLDFDNLYDALKDEYVILFRAHYFVSERVDLSKYEGFIYNVSKHDDVNELYVISDMLITDYSSVFFDYANLDRPIIFYMYDFDEYKDEMRGFYFGIEELPGPIIKEEKDLLPAIVKLGGEPFVMDETYLKFNKKFNPYRTACSAAVLEEIIE